MIWGIQKLRGPNFTQFRPPLPLQWTNKDILHTVPYFDVQISWFRVNKTYCVLLLATNWFNFFLFQSIVELVSWMAAFQMHEPHWTIYTHITFFRDEDWKNYVNREDPIFCIPGPGPWSLTWITKLQIDEWIRYPRRLGSYTLKMDT